MSSPLVRKTGLVSDDRALLLGGVLPTGLVPTIDAFPMLGLPFLLCRPPSIIARSQLCRSAQASLGSRRLNQREHGSEDPSSAPLVS